MLRTQLGIVLIAVAALTPLMASEILLGGAAVSPVSPTNRPFSLSVSNCTFESVLEQIGGKIGAKVVNDADWLNAMMVSELAVTNAILPDVCNRLFGALPYTIREEVAGTNGARVILGVVLPVPGPAPRMPSPEERDEVYSSFGDKAAFKSLKSSRVEVFPGHSAEELRLKFESRPSLSNQSEFIPGVTAHTGTNQAVSPQEAESSEVFPGFTRHELENRFKDK
ncbi:MAG: hypothetical protein HQ523_02010 [Lentisphaerae bacterium]|nr:hypothetical protein [Lentisphaerota bacterium]